MVKSNLIVAVPYVYPETVAEVDNRLQNPDGLDAIIKDIRWENPLACPAFVQPSPALPQNVITIAKYTFALLYESMRQEAAAEGLRLPTVTADARKALSKRLPRDEHDLQLGAARELFLIARPLAERFRSIQLPDPVSQAEVHGNWIMPFYLLSTQAQMNLRKKFTNVNLNTSTDLCEYATVADPRSFFKEVDSRFVPLHGNGTWPYLLWRRQAGTFVYANAVPELPRNFIAFASIGTNDRAVLELIREFQERTRTVVFPKPFDPSNPNYERLTTVMLEASTNPYFEKRYERNVSAASC